MSKDRLSPTALPRIILLMGREGQNQSCLFTCGLVMSQGGIVDTELMHHGSIALNPSELLRLRDAAGRQLSVVHGIAWITQESDSCDHVVRAGEHFRFDRDGLALVWPLDDAVRLLLEDGIVAEHPTQQEPITVTRNNWFAHSPELERRARRMRTEAIGQATWLVLAMLAKGLNTLMGQIGQVLAAVFQAVHTARELRTLSDSTLKGIGQRRGQISRVARTPPHWM
jgi:uncharacterized protein YjiS (DUF1127 family)